MYFHSIHTHGPWSYHLHCEMFHQKVSSSIFTTCLVSSNIYTYIKQKEKNKALWLSCLTGLVLSMCSFWDQLRLENISVTLNLLSKFLFCPFMFNIMKQFDFSTLLMVSIITLRAIWWCIIKRKLAFLWYYFKASRI